MTKTIRRILVPVDLSERRDAAFDRALLMARRWSSELYLFHRRPPWPISRFGIGEDVELERREAERSHLKALVRSASEEGVPVQVVSAEGDSARAIVAHAHLVMADLIVVARDFGSSHMWVLGAWPPPSADPRLSLFSSCRHGKLHPTAMECRSRRLSSQSTSRWRRWLHCEWPLTSSHRTMDEARPFMPCHMRRRWCFPAVKPQAWPPI